jgi:hypothetical protein
VRGGARGTHTRGRGGSARGANRGKPGRGNNSNSNAGVAKPDAEKASKKASTGDVQLTAQAAPAPKPKKAVPVPKPKKAAKSWKSVRGILSKEIHGVKAFGTNKAIIKSVEGGKLDVAPALAEMLPTAAWLQGKLEANPELGCINYTVVYNPKISTTTKGGMNFFAHALDIGSVGARPVRNALRGVVVKSKGKKSKSKSKTSEKKQGGTTENESSHLILGKSGKAAQNLSIALRSFPRTSWVPDEHGVYSGIADDGSWLWAKSLVWHAVHGFRYAQKNGEALVQEKRVELLTKVLKSAGDGGNVQELTSEQTDNIDEALMNGYNKPETGKYLKDKPKPADRVTSFCVVAHTFPELVAAAQLHLAWERMELEIDAYIQAQSKIIAFMRLVASSKRLHRLAMLAWQVVNTLVAADPNNAKAAGINTLPNLQVLLTQTRIGKVSILRHLVNTAMTYNSFTCADNNARLEEQYNFTLDTVEVRGTQYTFADVMDLTRNRAVTAKADMVEPLGVSMSDYLDLAESYQQVDRKRHSFADETWDEQLCTEVRRIANRVVEKFNDLNQRITDADEEYHAELKKWKPLFNGAKIRDVNKSVKALDEIYVEFVESRDKRNESCAKLAKQVKERAKTFETARTKLVAKLQKKNYDNPEDRLAKFDRDNIKGAVAKLISAWTQYLVKLQQEMEVQNENSREMRMEAVRAVQAAEQSTGASEDESKEVDRAMKSLKRLKATFASTQALSSAMDDFMERLERLFNHASESDEPTDDDVRQFEQCLAARDALVTSVASTGFRAPDVVALPTFAQLKA